MLLYAVLSPCVGRWCIWHLTLDIGVSSVLYFYMPTCILMLEWCFYFWSLLDPCMCGYVWGPMAATSKFTGFSIKVACWLSWVSVPLCWTLMLQASYIGCRHVRILHSSFLFSLACLLNALLAGCLFHMRAGLALACLQWFGCMPKCFIHSVCLQFDVPASLCWT